MLLLSASKLPCKMRGFASEEMLLPLAPPVLNTTLARRPPDRQGKVRDIYDLGDQLLFVATDRISAFDYVLGTGIPEKGRVLSQLTLFWLDFLKSTVANHLITADVKEYPAELQKYADQLRGRSMLVQKAQMVEIECVARGYLS